MEYFLDGVGNGTEMRLIRMKSYTGNLERIRYSGIRLFAKDTE
jgi:hypothetical protein